MTFPYIDTDTYNVYLSFKFYGLCYFQIERKEGKDEKIEKNVKR